MKKLLIVPVLALSLGACSNTLKGVVDDGSAIAHKTIDFTGDVFVKAVDITGDIITSVGETAVDAGGEVAKDVGKGAGKEAGKGVGKGLGI